MYVKEYVTGRRRKNSTGELYQVFPTVSGTIRVILRVKLRSMRNAMGAGMGPSKYIPGCTSRQMISNSGLSKY